MHDDTTTIKSLDLNGFFYKSPWAPFRRSACAASLGHIPVNDLSAEPCKATPCAADNSMKRETVEISKSLGYIFLKFKILMTEYQPSLESLIQPFKNPVIANRNRLVLCSVVSQPSLKICREGIA